MLLGRVNERGPLSGDFPALEGIPDRRPPGPHTDPEPWYWQMKVGFYLRGDGRPHAWRVTGCWACSPSRRIIWTPGSASATSIAARTSGDERTRAARHGEQPIALEHVPSC